MGEREYDNVDGDVEYKGILFYLGNFLFGIGFYICFFLR